MKIAMSLLSGVGYGGRTYFENFIPALVERDGTNEYHLFVPRGHDLMSRIASPRVIFHECMGARTSSIQRFLWEQIVLPRRLKQLDIDCMFTAKSMNIFFAPCKMIIASRNLEPFFYKEYENDWRLNVVLWVKRQLHIWSLKTADAVVAVSRAVKDRLIELFPRVTERVTVVYNGNPVTPPVILEGAKATDRIQDKGLDSIATASPSLQNDNSFILTASKFVAYANQLNLLKAYRLLCDRHGAVPALWFAGGTHDKMYFAKCGDFVKENGLEKKVRFLGLVSQQELFELYCRARLFVFPSTLESCPHTLIEAMACGAPIVASATPPMPEICADAALYFDPHDPQDIAQSIESVLWRDAERVRLSQAATARAHVFTWERTADEMVQVFEKVFATV